MLSHNKITEKCPCGSSTATAQQQLAAPQRPDQPTQHRDLSINQFQECTMNKMYIYNSVTLGRTTTCAQAQLQLTYKYHAMTHIKSFKGQKTKVYLLNNS